MGKGRLVLLGNSPFLNEIEIGALFNHTVVGFNGIGQHYPVDHVFCFDRWYAPGLAGTVWHPQHIQPQTADSQAFVYKSTPAPFLKKETREGLPYLAFKYFSPSIALNWAILEGFREIYLVGIDHIETDTRFQHHDGATCRSELTVEAHQAFKRFVYACAQWADIYQTNPAVQSGWDLPFKDIKTIYG